MMACAARARAPREGALRTSFIRGLVLESRSASGFVEQVALEVRITDVPRPDSIHVLFSRDENSHLVCEVRKCLFCRNAS